MRSLPGDLSGSSEEVKQFFDQWEIYRKVVEYNYLHHREAYAAIGESLRGVKGAFSVVDLGAGDASWTGPALAPCEVASYEAVDLSAVALALAEHNLRDLSCEKIFTQSDYFPYVQNRSEACDVIFVGLSLHHLKEPDKRVFFSHARRLLPEEGRLIFYEPIREPEESREEVLARWWKEAKNWSGLTSEELAKVQDHVFGYDYPEPLELFRGMASEAGFRDSRVRYVDEKRLYAVVECEA
ncbi:hypothetical protein BH09VER1_BH09VER1_33380 [soil metagenome]